MPLPHVPFSLPVCVHLPAAEASGWFEVVTHPVFLPTRHRGSMKSVSAHLCHLLPRCTTETMRGSPCTPYSAPAACGRPEPTYKRTEWPLFSCRVVVLPSLPPVPAAHVSPRMSFGSPTAAEGPSDCCRSSNQPQHPPWVVNSLQQQPKGKRAEEKNSPTLSVSPLPLSPPARDRRQPQDRSLPHRHPRLADHVLVTGATLRVPLARLDPAPQ